MCGVVWDTIVALVLTCVLLTTADSGSHHHIHPGNANENRFHDSAVVQDAEHIKEHLKDEINVDEKNMTAEELEFHYFKLHDTDNNTKLDGLEILQALAHMMPADDVVPPLKPEDTAGKTTEEIKKMEDERRDKVLDYYTGFIDRVMEDDDYDNDGYLTYIEYVLARRRDEQRYKQNQAPKKDEH
ncbi:multiple coagulation factor deficiency protein 2 homolog [Liolophura sinensis]|uniref:multiple coagulation factor deficiency protein 2 homolog n=1 Tax=Liolophura sinensis TaxID=3198878 RepID=UPI003159023A